MQPTEATLAGPSAVAMLPFNAALLPSERCPLRASLLRSIQYAPAPFAGQPHCAGLRHGQATCSVLAHIQEQSLTSSTHAAYLTLHLALKMAPLPASAQQFCGCYNGEIVRAMYGSTLLHDASRWTQCGGEVVFVQV